VDRPRDVIEHLSHLAGARATHIELIRVHSDGDDDGCKTVVTTTARLRFDGDSTAIRPRYDRSTPYDTTGLLRCGGNKEIGQRDCG